MAAAAGAGVGVGVFLPLPVCFVLCPEGFEGITAGAGSRPLSMNSLRSQSESPA